MLYRFPTAHPPACADPHLVAQPANGNRPPSVSAEAGLPRSAAAGQDTPTTGAWPAVPPPHAVSRLRSARLARSSKPFLARGGSTAARCSGCRLLPSHCMCALRPTLATRAGMCLVMADIEALKPSNTGWLIADVVPDTFAFGWARTEVDPALLALLSDPQWQPYLVFPGDLVAPERVLHSLPGAPERRGAGGCANTNTNTNANANASAEGGGGAHGRRPLFVLLDGTWPEARKMFHKSPYLDSFPVLSLAPQVASRYRLRRSRRDDHFCTSEVAALCLHLAGEAHAADTLQAYLEVYTHHYLQARHQQPPDLQGEAHAQWGALRRPGA